MNKVIVHGHPKECEAELQKISKDYDTCIRGMTGYGNGDKIAIIVDLIAKPKILKEEIRDVTEIKAIREGLVIPDET